MGVLVDWHDTVFTRLRIKLFLRDTNDLWLEKRCGGEFNASCC